MTRFTRIALMALVISMLGAQLASAQFADGSAPTAPKPVDDKDSTWSRPGPWRLTGIAGLTLTQSASSDNWYGGDRGSWMWVARFDGTAERQFNPRFHSSNTLQLAYGQTSQQQIDPNNPQARVWDTPSKSTDRIGFESVGRFTLDRWADPYFAASVVSQFLDQSQPNGTLSFNPVQVKLSAGLSKTLVKQADRELITRLGVGARSVFGRNFVEPLPSQQTASYNNSDAGLEWVTTTTWPLLDKRVLYKGRLGLFQPFMYSQSSELKAFDQAAMAADPTRRAVADYWKAVDINFENTFSAAITKNLSVELFAQLVYNKFDSAGNVDPNAPLAVTTALVDRNIRLAGQFRETLALALSMRLF